MSQELKLGLVGCDTSHCVAFARILNDPKNEYHVPGAKITTAFPGGSPDFELSISRVEGFVKELSEQWGATLADSPAKVAEACDAVLLTSVDARVHLDQFREIAPFKKPVFIDKPFALEEEAAREMFRLAGENGIPLMSCSSLRFADGFTGALGDDADGALTGADFYGPMAIQETQPGFFWYGIHVVEMLYAAFGTGCREVSVVTNDDHDLVTAVWGDGRIATLRGNRVGNNKFGGVLQREKGSRFVDIYSAKRPYYASLLEKIMVMFTTGAPQIKEAETVEIVRFIQAANRARETGQQVTL